jgi:ABC-2 type transport system ATP-binding protein
MEHTETMIEVAELVKRFGDHTAVDRVSFSVSQGEVFGLLGPNERVKARSLRF